MHVLFLFHIFGAFLFFLIVNPISMYLLKNVQYHAGFNSGLKITGWFEVIKSYAKRD